jgi:hypothetical protein
MIICAVLTTVSGILVTECKINSHLTSSYVIIMPLTILYDTTFVHVRHGIDEAD